MYNIGNRYTEVLFIMKSIKISLEMVQKVKEFVNVTQNYPFEKRQIRR